MRVGRIVVGVILSRALAHAEPPPNIEGPRLIAGASLELWIPAGDIDDYASPSLAIRPTFLYRALPMISVVGTFDWVFVDERPEAMGSITYYAISAGMRVSKKRASGLEPFGELLVGYHKLEATGVDDGGIGFRLGGGVMYPIGGTLIATAGIAGSTVSIDVGIFGIDVSALVLDAGLGARF